jgi:hypothetical protein
VVKVRGDIDRELAYAARDLLHRLFIQAMDVEILKRIQKHAGGVIKVDLLKGEAGFTGGHRYPDLSLKLRDKLDARIVRSACDLRVRARVMFKQVSRSCVITDGVSQIVRTRNFIECTIRGKSIARFGKWHVWSPDAWDHWLDWPADLEAH